MLFTIGAAELRRALEAIEAAERNGFMYCEAVLDSDSMLLSGLRLRYSDIWEKAHPTDRALDWGRYQGVSRRYRFADGVLLPIDEATDATK